MYILRVLFPVLLLAGSAAASCGAGLSSCNGQCYQTGANTCALDYNGKYQLCPLNFGSCNGACYSASQYHCDGGVLKQGAATAGNAATSTKAAAATTTKAATTSAAATTKAAATSAATTTKAAATSAAATTTAAAVVVNPVAAASNSFPTQTADLRIINNCKSTLWFEARYGGGGLPLPGYSTTATQALPGSYVDYTVPATGLAGSRFWAKYGCDSNGHNCQIGDQMQYYPGGGCPTNGCTPPVDSLFEATWGCKPGSSCNSGNPTTWFDTSQVDGYTIPYTLTANGATNGCDCSGSNCGFSGIDASDLDLSRCPSGDNLSDNGAFTSITSSGKTFALDSIDLRLINSNNQIIGCMSPCKRLNYGTPYGLGQSESIGSAMWMCCPTPDANNCLASEGCITPDECRAGPIATTEYVEAIHDMAKGVYAYSYDDGVGLHACPAGTVTYTMEFCPSGSSSYPYQL